MATYKEKNFIADEEPQKKRPGKRNSPEREYLKTLGSSKERVQDIEVCSRRNKCNRGK